MTEAEHMMMLIELQRELTELMKQNVEEITVLKQENETMRRN